MPRIRSIKPDFFTSETIAALPLSARLTFIGLWTHVDDNGVTVDNPKLIVAALWPLEDDPAGTLRRTADDLARLAAAGLVQRYETAGRRLLFITSWDEHQKVSHPGRDRFPRPEPGQVLPPDPPQSSGESPETLQSPRETLRPEQGAGSREQGAGSATRRAASPPARRPADTRSTLALVQPPDPPDTTGGMVAEWLDHCRKRPPASVIGQVGKHVRAMLAEGIDADDIRSGLAQWHSRGQSPSSLPSFVNEVMNANPAARQARASPSTTDARVGQALALAAQLEHLEPS